MEKYESDPNRDFIRASRHQALPDIPQHISQENQLRDHSINKNFNIPQATITSCKNLARQEWYKTKKLWAGRNTKHDEGRKESFVCQKIKENLVGRALKENRNSLGSSHGKLHRERRSPHTATMGGFKEKRECLTQQLQQELNRIS